MMGVHVRGLRLCKLTERELPKLGLGHLWQKLSLGAGFKQVDLRHLHAFSTSISTVPMWEGLGWGQSW